MNPLSSLETKKLPFIPKEISKTIVTDLVNNWPLDIKTVNSNQMDLSCCLECKDQNSNLGKKINVENIKDLLGIVKDQTGQMVDEAKGILTITTVTKVVTKTVTTIRNAIKGIFQKIKDELDPDKILGYIKLAKNLQKIAEEPWNFINGLVNAGLSGLLGDKVEKTLNKVFGFADKIKAGINGAIETAGNFINGINAKLKEINMNIITPVVGIISKLGSLIQPVKGFFNFLKTSLSEKLLNLKANILGKASALISSLGNFIADSIGGLVQNATKTFSILRTEWSRLLDGGLQYASNFADTLKRFDLKKLASSVKGLLSSSGSIFSSLYDKLLNFSSDSLFSFFEKLNFDKASQLFRNLLKKLDINKFLDKTITKVETLLETISTSFSLSCLANAGISSAIATMEKNNDYTKVDDLIDQLNCSQTINNALVNNLSSVNLVNSSNIDKLSIVNTILENRPSFQDCKIGEQKSYIKKTDFVFDAKGVF